MPVLYDRSVSVEKDDGWQLVQDRAV
jgi:hypothetical protein